MTLLSPNTREGKGVNTDLSTSVPLENANAKGLRQYCAHQNRTSHFPHDQTTKVPTRDGVMVCSVDLYFAVK